MSEGQMEASEEKLLRFPLSNFYTNSCFEKYGLKKPFSVMLRRKVVFPIGGMDRML